MDAVLEEFAGDVGDLVAVSRVEILKTPPSPLSFVQNYLVPHVPVIVKGLIDDWPALHRWSDPAYLEDLCGEVEVSVNVTPSGHGDRCVRDASGRPLFVKPEERRMKFSDFQRALAEPERFSGVPYLVTLA